MSDPFKRLTLVIPLELEAQMKNIKKDVFFDRTQSEMVRALLSAGMRASAGPGEEESGGRRAQEVKRT